MRRWVRLVRKGLFFVLNDLQEWQLRRLAGLRNMRPVKCGLTNVTLLAYHFWNEDEFDRQLDYLECSIRETWRNCGMLKTVLVVNRLSDRLNELVAEAEGMVKLDLACNLVPGKIYSMSVDCNANLHRRFETDYVLIVQNDGFPIRHGLEEFVGRWDFVGAPYVRDIWSRRLFCSFFNCWVSNGGFSLRSKNICELASYYWHKKYADRSDSRAVSEDIFYTETLPLRERRYRKEVRLASTREARRFAYDAALKNLGTTPPFGFHGTKAFEALRAAGWISEGLSEV